MKVYNTIKGRGLMSNQQKSQNNPQNKGKNSKNKNNSNNGIDDANKHAGK